MAAGPFTGVIHCYSSSRRLAERAVAIGLYLGIGGILTFKKSDELRATVARHAARPPAAGDRRALPGARCPMRGRTNEPAYTAHVAKVLAEVRGLPIAEIAAATTANFLRLFAKVARPHAR